MRTDCRSGHNTCCFFVTHINVHKRTCTEEALDSQVHRKTVLWILAGLSMHHPSTWHWAQEESGHGSRDEGYAWTQCGLSLTKDIFLPLLIAQPPSSRDWCWALDKGTIPYEDQTATCWHIDYIGHLPPWLGHQIDILKLIDSEYVLPSRTAVSPLAPSESWQNSSFLKMGSLPVP